MSIELDIDFSDLKESTVRRIAKTLLMKQARSSMPAGKRPDEENEAEEDEGETESDKLAQLHSESHGSPAPLPVTESDFREGDVRKALKKLPPKARGTKKA
jgi:hypothetical protein